MATDPSRRRFLHNVALGLGVLACNRAMGQPAEDAAFAVIETAARTGLSRALFFAASGAPLTQVPLDFRAHGMAAHGDTLVVFPRRPGDRFAIIDRRTLAIRATITAPAGRHFFGHGAFTTDGQHLLVTENDLETLQGFLGVYRLDGAIRRIGQIALPRPGPHEITRDRARDVFYIALGGLETHPEYGRAPLNLADFRSEITLLDFATGALSPLGLWPGSEGISLRHLAMADDGRLYVGGQMADAARADTGAVLWLVAEGRVQRLDAGMDLGGYVSSVAAYGPTASVSSKESGVVLDLIGDKVVARQAIAGAGAVARGPFGTAAAGYRLLSLNGADHLSDIGFEFDNHALATG